MIVLACIEALVVAAVVVLFLRDRRTAETAWATERRELLNRIQRPDLVPTVRVDSFTLPDREPDDMELVGTIKYEPDEVS